MVKRLFLSVVLLFAIPLTSCNNYTKAQTAHNIVAAIIAVAQAEVPVIPMQDQAVYVGFFGSTTAPTSGLLPALNSQYQICITNAQNTMLTTAGKFLGCLNAFATGLANPQELAQLRILSASSKGKTQLYITGAIAGINAAIAIFGGQAQPAPTVGPGPSVSELRQLRTQVVTAIGQ